MKHIQLEAERDETERLLALQATIAERVKEMQYVNKLLARIAELEAEVEKLKTEAK